MEDFAIGVSTIYRRGGIDPFKSLFFLRNIVVAPTRGRSIIEGNELDKVQYGVGKNVAQIP